MRRPMKLPLRQLIAIVLVMMSVPLASTRAIEPRTDIIAVDDLATRDDLESRALWPSLDPFYKPPKGWESKKPGDILRTRRIIPAFYGFVPSIVEGHQILYRTTAVDGSPITTVTTVFKPLFAKKDRFISFQTAYDSASTSCNPSYTYQLGAIPLEIPSSAERLIITLYLLSGYVVSSSDYEGPEAAFVASHLVGMAVLDSIRAVGNYAGNIGLNTNNPAVVGVGYSGGGHASGWAASLQKKYAPELNIKGWSMGGVPSNLTGILSYIDNTLFSGFIPTAINGLTRASTYKAQLGDFIDEITTKKAKKTLALANALCTVEQLIAFPYQSVLSESFQSLGSGLLYNETITDVLSQNIMGVNADEVPIAPIHMYHAIPDEIVPYQNSSTTREAWCNQGASVDYVTYVAGGHVTTEVLDLPATLKFVSNAFEGKLAGGCSTKSVLDDKFDPIALGVNLEPIAVKLLQILVTAGKKDANILKDINVLKKNILG